MVSRPCREMSFRNGLLLLALLAQAACGRTREVERAGDGVARGAATAPAPPRPPSAAAPGGEGAAHQPLPAPAQPSATLAAQPTAQAAAPRRRYRVLALGDSITDQNVGGGGYLRELGRACPHSRFEHFGRGGDMTNQMRRRFEQELPRLSGEIDTLIVFGGVNDLYSDLTAGRTNDRIEEDLTAIYRAAKDRGLSVVAITVAPWGGFTRYFNERRSRTTRLLNSWILGTSARGQTDVVVDAYSLLSCGDPERLCPDYEGRSQDGLHPGPFGHAVLGQALLERAFADCE